MLRMWLAVVAVVSAVPALASDQRPTPSEFRQFMGQSSYSIYLCKVVAPAGAAFHRTIAGAPAGRLSNGKEFALSGVAYGAARQLWFRVDFVYQSPVKGWVLASDAICHTDSTS